ncbi:MAG: iron ABC transporter permease, partial [Clostridiales bacterium]|nr:iron ABC transporter permease [Clostridiales bacterium]
MPYSILIGGIFMMVVDMLARSIAPNEIPLSVVTGIIGTPLFIFTIFKKRKDIK